MLGALADRVECRNRPASSHGAIMRSRIRANAPLTAGCLRRLFSQAPFVAVGWWLLLAPPGMAADPPKVTITGGADASGHNYNWTVANETASPIVHLEFPHYHATLFFAPEGWSTECTFLVNVGVDDRPGICRAHVDSPASGIAPGRSAPFSMQVATRAVQRAGGEVTVRTADGAEIVITGVELPEPETTSDKYVSLVGLAAVLLVAVALQRGRGRGKPARRDDKATAPPADQ